MRIDEVESTDAGADPNKLVGLVNFLAGRADDTNAQKQKRVPPTFRTLQHSASEEYWFSEINIPQVRNIDFFDDFDFVIIVSVQVH